MTIRAEISGPIHQPQLIIYENKNAVIYKANSFSELKPARPEGTKTDF